MRETNDKGFSPEAIADSSRHEEYHGKRTGWDATANTQEVFEAEKAADSTNPDDYIVGNEAPPTPETVAKTDARKQSEQARIRNWPEIQTALGVTKEPNIPEGIRNKMLRRQIERDPRDIEKRKYD